MFVRRYIIMVITVMIIMIVIHITILGEVSLGTASHWIFHNNKPSTEVQTVSKIFILVKNLSSKE